MEAEELNGWVDRMVAEHVMGLGPHTHKSEWIHGISPDEYGDCPGWWCLKCHGPKMPAYIHLRKPEQNTCYNYSLKSYSTSLDYAWEIVKKLQANNYTFGLHYPHEQQEIVRVYFTARSILRPMPQVGEDRSVPMAICIAALKVMRVEVPAA